MSNDKHRSLARRVAWLRSVLGASDHGFATGIKHAVAINDDILRLEAESLLERLRMGTTGSAGRTLKRSEKTYTSFRATPAGIGFLADALAARGADFAPPELVKGPHKHTLSKTVRRQHAILAKPSHILRAEREDRLRRTLVLARAAGPATARTRG